jgi:hypoxanthine phosphoribosyltransferase
MGNASSESSLEVLLDTSRIARRVRELGAEISRDYHGRTPHLVGVLKGAWIFMADLIRNLSIEATVDFLGIQSYVAGTTSSGEVKITKDLDASIAGRDVLVVEDILDTGRTYFYLQGVLSTHQPKTLKLATLLDKTSRRVVPVKADYVGFQIPNVFVVGYGLDYNQQFRRLPEVWFLRSYPDLDGTSLPGGA